MAVPPLEPQAYKDGVLVRHGQANTVPGLIERYALDPAVRPTEAELDARGAELWLLWNQARRDGRSKHVVSILRIEHQDKNGSSIDRLKTDAGWAAAVADAGADGERLAQQRFALGEVLGRFPAQGGVPQRDYENLARRFGAEFVRQELERSGLSVGTLAAGPEPLPEQRRVAIRQRLAEYAGLRPGAGDDPRRYATLYDFLADFDEAFGRRWGGAGAPPAWPDLAAAIAGADRAQAQTRAGNLKTVLRDLLSECRLLETDQAAYDAGRRADFQSHVEFLMIGLFGPGEMLRAVGIAQLAMDCVAHGLSGEEGAAVVRLAARDYGIAVEAAGLGAGVVTVITCPACQSPNVERGQQRCETCEADLYRVCPGCRRPGPAVVVTCPHCGLDAVLRERAVRALADARRHAVAGRVEAALDAVRTAQGHEPGLAEATTLEAELTGRRARTLALWSRLDGELSQRRLTAAQATLKELADTAGDVLAPDGRTAAAVKADVERRIADAARRLARVPASGPASEAALVDVLAAVADQPEALRRLTAMPPAPATDVLVTPDERGVRLAWAASPSPGVVEYVVVRKAGSAPGGPADGVLVARSSGITAADTSTEPGSVVGYAVFASRAGATSSAAASSTLLVAHAPELTLTPGDGRVRLTWARVGLGSIEIERHGSGVPPVRLVPGRSGGTVDEGLDNGELYEYVAVAVHRGADGRPVRSAEARKRVRPDARPQPVTDLRAEADADGVRLSWTAPPSGAVTIVRTDTVPQLEVGGTLGAGELRRLGTPLVADGGTLRDRRPLRRAWYVPITATSTEAVVGAAVGHAAVPALRGVRVVDHRSQLQVDWEWPEGVAEARVLWRTDAPPAGPEDPAAQQRAVKRSLAAVRGCRLPVDTGSPAIHVLVCPGIRVDGATVYGVPGVGARATIGREEVARVGYEVQVGRRLRGGKTLTVRVEGGADAPIHLAVVHHASVMPLALGAGEQLGVLTGEAPVLELAYPGPGFVRAFSVEPRVAVDDPPVRKRTI